MSALVGVAHEMAREGLSTILWATARVSVVVIVALVGTSLLARRRAALRSFVWHVVACVALALPVLSAILPVWSVRLDARVTGRGITTVAPWIESIQALRDGDSRPPPNDGPASAAAPHRAPTARAAVGDVGSTSSSRVDWMEVLFVLWGAGVAAAVLRLLISSLRLVVLERRAERATDRRLIDLVATSARSLGIVGPVRVLVGSPRAAPIVWGVARPRLLLPDGWQHWPEAVLAAVVQHELAHVRRRDIAAQLMCDLALALHWFNPLVWLAAREARLAREQSCDDEVVEAGVTPGAYAEALLVLLGLLRRSARSSGPALAIAGRRELARRIESLVDASRLRQRLSRRATASITVVALFGAGALSSISLAEPSAMTGGDAPAGVPPCCDGAMPIVAGAVGLALDSAFASMARDGFAGTVLVEHRGEVVFAKGFGLADRARRTPNRVTTRYHVAGITKVFTAAVTLALVDRALIELDAPVSRYLPELRGSVADVTIHQLLIHTDGLSDVHERHRPTSSSAFIRALNASSPAFRAGQSYGPGNAGHSLLALVVERIARQPFERVLREWMMQPAGMTSSFLRWEAGVSMDSVALGYVRDGPADPVTPGPDVWGVRGSRGLVTTVGDLHRWYMAYVTGRLVSRRSIESMRTPHVTTSKAFHQGYGWLLYDEGSTEPFRAGPAGLVRRSGRESGYEAELVHDIGGDWVAIVLVNSDALLRLRAIEAIRAVANAQPPPRVASP